jgi:hypothetical protein
MRDGEKRGQVGAAMRDTTMASAFSERGCSGLSHRTGLLKYGKRNWDSLVCEATHRWRPNESLSTDQIAEGRGRRSGSVVDRELQNRLPAESTGSASCGT